GKSTLGKYHDSVASAAKKYNVPFDVAAGIMAHETGKGTSSAWNKKNNPGGIMDPKSGWSRTKHYNSPEEGIDDAVRVISKNWGRAKGDLKKLGSIYAPIGARNDPKGLNKHWLPGVTSYASKFKQTDTQVAQPDAKPAPIEQKPSAPTQNKVATSPFDQS
ncbi:MAG: glucosaminidase domain-containing protein, partial [Flammeovirgaceae bacterium]